MQKARASRPNFPGRAAGHRSAPDARLPERTYRDSRLPWVLPLSCGTRGRGRAGRRGVLRGVAGRRGALRAATWPAGDASRARQFGGDTATLFNSAAWISAFSVHARLARVPAVRVPSCCADPALRASLRAAATPPVTRADPRVALASSSFRLRLRRTLPRPRSPPCATGTSRAPFTPGFARTRPPGRASVLS